MSIWSASERERMSQNADFDGCSDGNNLWLFTWELWALATDLSAHAHFDARGLLQRWFATAEGV